uniref:Juvenile hormone binding protein n=1 Tax=Heliothis virescens TaxID=7102 RepID=A0A2A4J409_HELVI
MAAYTSFLLLAFASCVLSEGGVFFNPCYKSDIKCLSNATETFLEKTCNGYPNTEIKAIDPLVIPELKVVVDESMGLVFDFKNINIVGLKNQQISDFKMDTDKKSVVLKTKAILNIVADLKIEFTKQNKVFNGPYIAKTTALGSSQYGYSFTKKDDKEYFVVGSEKNACEIIGEPDVEIGEELQKALLNDADAKAMKPDYEANKVTLRKKTLCHIVEAAYVTVIHNIRAVAKLFPKEAFFLDI